MKHTILISFLLFLSTSIFAQKSVVFSFTASSLPLKLNEMCYKSQRGLTYQVCQVQYFVSNLRILGRNGSVNEIFHGVHYVDVEIPKTLKLQIPKDFALNSGDSLVFTFGLDSIDNRSYRYRNPPENLMFWPDYLGGGYHYMKTNILYKTTDNQTNAFNCHIGRGQVYNAENKPVSYIENAFDVAIPISLDSDGNIVINLAVDRIFDFPTPVLFTDYRGIMNNQKAMKLLSNNIKFAFGKKTRTINN